MITESTASVLLTKYSHGAGCGCKISPAILDKILHHHSPLEKFPALLVGNESKDDAAVFDLGEGNCVISTTDFFMPIVDDPFAFGSIASVNAISDVYAMGGEPIMAVAILGWPIDKLSPEIAQKVLEGSRRVCTEAGIPLAGGHSIDCPEPVFGLAVTGKIKREHLKRNDTSKVDSVLYLTKPLGIGLVTTAQKKGMAQSLHVEKAVETMLELNKLGADLGRLPYVNALTDVTGFGFLGHLCEMCEGSKLSASISFGKIPQFNFLDEYVSKNAMPGGTQRNWQSYGHKISEIPDLQKAILADPQTSGGLLISVNGTEQNEFEKFLESKNQPLKPFGKMAPAGKFVVNVKN
jgi:selenide, water dikinase